MYCVKCGSEVTKGVCGTCGHSISTKVRDGVRAVGSAIVTTSMFGLWCAGRLARTAIDTVKDGYNKK